MPSAVELLAVDLPQVPGIWPHARAMVKRAMDKVGSVDFPLVEREVLAGLQQLWLASDGETIEAAAVTQLTTIGDRKTCVLVACSGTNMDVWLPLLKNLEEFAKAEGCGALRINGRKGWSRLLDDYPLKYVVMEKEFA